MRRLGGLAVCLVAALALWGQPAWAQQAYRVYGLTGSIEALIRIQALAPGAALIDCQAETAPCPAGQRLVVLVGSFVDAASAEQQRTQLDLIGIPAEVMGPASPTPSPIPTSSPEPPAVTPAAETPVLVIVPGSDPELLRRIRQVSADAFVRRLGDQAVIQAGTYRQRSNAEYAVQALAEAGINAQILSAPVDLPIAPPPAAPPAPPSRAKMITVGGVRHYAYAVIAESELEAVNAIGQRMERLQRDAARAFRQMQQAARAEGLSLQPISCFRDLRVQTSLFNRQVQRQGSVAAAMRLSAPPGYSEHHTGYAVDIGDARQPQTHLRLRFGQTAAYRWLQARAGSWGFELSFPPDNAQGVSYEPWHWRYVGSPAAQAIFAAAKDA